ncbi:hypothetical protein COU77_04260 [Candidatus Peregrinibacteria bacterium CG10_big_fil_rev_8_21_14_0_10_49_16]|nr:MAG: hypothetical protein COW95_01575 [Candidatus Peregrinibacteria bacterium CG22_combo_CG10-13_8_21_14_all_49_11]PIR51706.1 MAG: hypothetical protein COU77_04260 [Candidatus Peregrinibacteria bacterium CG10_big_fil_rev_8_21_14_0_10_49_16]
MPKKPCKLIDNLKVKRGLAGLGLFTEEPIKRGSFIIEYFGPLLTEKEADRKAGLYLFEVPDSKWTIDGSGRDNIARYINHSCKPNCETIANGKRIYIHACRNIQAGEELSYDYGKDYMDGIPCICGYCPHPNPLPQK